MIKFQLYIVLVAASFSFTLAGCDSGNGTVPVEGTVQYQGQPVPGITTIRFQPEGGERPSSGSTDENGHFVLIYSINEMGVKPGKFAVTFGWDETSPDAQITPEIEAILKKHGPEGTPYEVEITGAITDLVINVE